MIRVGVIGAGLIGRERLSAVKSMAKKGRAVELAGVFEVNQSICEETATKYETKAFSSIDALLKSKPDWVVVALPHEVAVAVALQVLDSGAKVLIEKPLGRDLHEAQRLLAVGGDRLSVGFNYRFFPGVRRALQDLRAGVFGKTIGIEFFLGHGCNPGIEKTWKLNPEKAGGGCLIDPGVHLLDLCMLLEPHNIEVVGGTTWSGFWNTGIEEDVNLLLGCDGFSVTVRVSVAYWRSTFRMAISGTDAYGIVTGRGRSYGPQTYITGPRWGWQNAANQAASETLVVESDCSESFADEFEALLFPESDSDKSWPRPCTAQEAMNVMKLLDRCRERLGLLRQWSKV